MNNQNPNQIPLKAEKEWPEYQTMVAQLGDSHYRVIFRRGQIAAVVKSFYEVVPLEETKALVDEIMLKLAGVKPFREYDNFTRLYELYALPEEYEFHDGSKVQLGIYCLNSIDGSTKLQFDIFTYRNTCANVVFLALKPLIRGAKLSELKELVREKKGETADFGPVAHLSVKHTKGGIQAWQRFKMKVEWLLSLGNRIIDIYRQWEETRLTNETAEKLAEKLPKKILEHAGFEFTSHGLSATPSGSLFDIYNDITAAIWHKPITLERKIYLYSNLHTVLIPAEAVRI